MHKFLCGHLSSFLLGIYLGVELLDHMVTLFNFVRIAPEHFVYVFEHVPLRRWLLIRFSKKGKQHRK